MERKLIDTTQNAVKGGKEEGALVDARLKKTKTGGPTKKAKEGIEENTRTIHL